MSIVNLFPIGYALDLSLLEGAFMNDYEHIQAHITATELITSLDKSPTSSDSPSPFTKSLLSSSAARLSMDTNLSRTENNALTYKSTLSPHLDFFFSIINGTPAKDIHDHLNICWEKQPDITLKLIWQLRDIKRGKAEKSLFHEALFWLYSHHPQTLFANLKFIPKDAIGCWKDLPTLLSIVTARLSNDPIFKKPTKPLKSGKGSFRRHQRKERHEQVKETLKKMKENLNADVEAYRKERLAAARIKDMEASENAKMMRHHKQIRRYTVIKELFLSNPHYQQLHLTCDKYS